MLELRPSCENCGLALPPDSDQAYTCSFECTFCRTCVTDVLENVCPNCTGGLTPRPVRPPDLLLKYPPSHQTVFHPVDLLKQEELIRKFGKRNSGLGKNR